MANLFIALTYNLKKDKVRVTSTNIKPERIPEVLESYLLSIIGAGADKRKPNRRREYHIQLDLALASDTFTTRSDTGNKGLTTGILMQALGQLGGSTERLAELTE